MSRLYAVQSTPSNTGAIADHRLPLKARDIEKFSRNVAAALGVAQAQAAGAAPADMTHKSWMDALVRDLQAHRGTGIVIAGEQQPPIVHALAHAMNQALGNAGNTVTYIEPVEAVPVDQLGFFSGSLCTRWMPDKLNWAACCSAAIRFTARQWIFTFRGQYVEQVKNAGSSQLVRR